MIFNQSQLFATPNGSGLVVFRIASGSAARVNTDGPGSMIRAALSPGRSFHVQRGTNAMMRGCMCRDPRQGA